MAIQTFAMPSSIAKLDKLVKILESPMTRHEIQLAAHLGKRTANTYIAKLIADKRVYVQSWKREQDGMKTHLRPVYAAGNLPDKKKPAALTQKQINRRKYERIKSDPEVYAAFLARERHRMSMMTFKPKPDAFAASWLFDRNQYPAEEAA